MAGQEVQVDGNEVAWFLLTSSNLSRSAWGFLDKASLRRNNTIETRDTILSGSIETALPRLFALAAEVTYVYIKT